MNDNDRAKFTVIENTQSETVSSTPETFSAHTSPLIKNLLKFHHSKANKFSVRDLFKR